MWPAFDIGLRAEAFANQFANTKRNLRLWAGQVAPLLRYRKAGELMDAMVQEEDQLFAQFW
jgi:hypothetical protein